MADPGLRIALIGAGGIGRLHLNLWRDLPDVEVVGLYDVSREAAARASSECGIQTVFESLDEPLADERVDAVDVCVPNNAHAHVVVAALDAGKHCLCEKPLAATAADIERMIVARDRSGRMLMTAQHMRFDDAALAFKKYIDAGRLGEIYYARAWWLRRRMTPVSPGFLCKTQSGGGPCIDIGVHMLDLALHYMGFPRPVRVSGVAPCKLAKRAGIYNEWGEYDPDDFEVEDFAAGLVRFDNGAALVLEVSWMLNIDRDDDYGVQLCGVEGGGRWPQLAYNSERDGRLFTGQMSDVSEGNGYANELRAFVEAIRAGDPSPVPAEQSLTITRVLEGLYASSESGCETRL